MARQYHNLAGLCRDLKAALGAGDQLAYEFAELVIEADDLVDSDVAPAVESTADDADHAADDNQADVDGEGLEGREADAPRPRRHDARGESHRAAPSGLGRILDGVPGRKRAPAESGLANVRGGTVGAPLTRVTTRRLV